MGRDAYPVTRTIQTRWTDNDAFGHMNNAVHYQFFDTMVNDTLAGLGCHQRPDDPTRFLVVETGCRYLVQMRYPDRITLGLRVEHLGRSSVRYALGMFRAEEHAPSAEGHFVHVNVDVATGRPTPITDDLRKGLERLQMEDSVAE